MFARKSVVPKPARRLLAAPSSPSQEPKQRRMMVIALSILLVALGFVLYRDRDFWFPDTQEADNQPSPTERAKTIAAQTSAMPKTSSRTATPARHRASDPPPKPEDSSPTAPAAPPITTVASRTVLPPLEVEVVAGNIRRALLPNSNSVRVDLRPGSPAQAVSPSPADNNTEIARATNAAERVQTSADTVDVVSHKVKPDYPLLARQMKVQGSVVLQVLIGRNGLIQDLRVVSGPPILANAAQEAVKQWHFKPHYLGPDAVETQARITVNFTISTN